MTPPTPPTPATTPATTAADPMTDAELFDVSARAGAATPEPWYVSDGSACGFEGEWDVSGPDYCGLASMSGTAEVAKFPRDKEANAEFIAHARTDVPRMFHEIMRLRRELAATRAALASCRAAHAEMDRHERAVSYERCPDCDCPDQCSREAGCASIAGMGGSTVQQIIRRAALADADRAGTEGG